MGMSKVKVMIAGAGGASLGTELIKCLNLAGTYEVSCCDISRTAFGLYEPGVKQGFVVDRNDYVPSVVAACREACTSWLIPGGEQPMALLASGIAQLKSAGIRLLANHPDYIRLFSDKQLTFVRLAELGFVVPRTELIDSKESLALVGLPCIVKPATGTGGSAAVFFAVSEDEAMTYVSYLRRAGQQPIAQEYLPDDEGEFTVGVLSSPEGKVMGSIALRRSLDTKLSVMMRGRGGVVSSGYSQGYIGNFPEVRRVAEEISQATGSRGPVNIQGRLRNGTFVPFEINPRFSASAYLRAMAGFNEVDLLLRNVARGEGAPEWTLREGWYLRSLTERFIAPEELKS